MCFGSSGNKNRQNRGAHGSRPAKSKRYYGHPSVGYPGAPYTGHGHHHHGGDGGGHGGHHGGDGGGGGGGDGGGGGGGGGG
ncbi:hypothetical protein G7Z17_g2834 [Cylindrodendrum hubeiense]|uniref:Uncharacterized protein n=1 Tax=Cylindrodendrum hubeiense TaxID=595255 RepID=A0A9P5HK20_9HYPO|nr:hypothetical protein G7Z17_g2834 [Cylindrodendrum hubeiense]